MKFELEYNDHNITTKLEGFSDEVILEFSQEFQTEWGEEVGSGKYWHGPAPKQVKPRVDALTIRSGRLVESLKGNKPSSIQHVEVKHGAFEVVRGSSLVYAGVHAGRRSAWNPTLRSLAHVVKRAQEFLDRVTKGLYGKYFGKAN